MKINKAGIIGAATVGTIICVSLVACNVVSDKSSKNDKNNIKANYTEMSNEDKLAYSSETQNSDADSSTNGDDKSDKIQSDNSVNNNNSGNSSVSILDGKDTLINQNIGNNLDGSNEGYNNTGTNLNGNISNNNSVDTNLGHNSNSSAGSSTGSSGITNSSGVINGSNGNGNNNNTSNSSVNSTLNNSSNSNSSSKNNASSNGNVNSGSNSGSNANNSSGSISNNNSQGNNISSGSSSSNSNDNSSGNNGISGINSASNNNGVSGSNSSVNNNGTLGNGNSNSSNSSGSGNTSNSSSGSGNGSTSNSSSGSGSGSTSNSSSGSGNGSASNSNNSSGSASSGSGTGNATNSGSSTGNNTNSGSNSNSNSSGSSTGASTTKNDTFTDTMYDYTKAGMKFSTGKVAAKDYISVTEYGIKPNTGKDVSKKVIEAIYDTASKDKYLYFPEGTYCVKNVKIKNTNNIKICGAGQKTIIKTISTASRDVWDITMGIYDSEDVVIRNLVFDGNNENVEGTTEIGVMQLRIDNCENVKVYGCRFQDNNYGNINIVNEAKNLQIFYCDFLNSDCSIITSPGYINKGYICNNFIDGEDWVYSEPISLYYADDRGINTNLVISGNDIRNHTQAAGGIFVTYPSTNVSIVNNYIYKCGAGIGSGSQRQSASSTYGPTYLVVRENVIDSPTWHGMELKYADNWSITDNIIKNITDGFGIYLDQCDNNDISKNTIDGGQVIELDCSGNKINNK